MHRDPARSWWRRRRVVAPVALGLAGLLLGAQPAVIIAVSGGVAAAAPTGQGPWSAQDLPALESSGASGPRFHQPDQVRLDMTASSVSTSTRPTLVANLKDSANGRRVVFRILSADGQRALSSSTPITVARGTAQWQVPRGVLKPFQAYRMALLDAQNLQTKIIGPRPLTVDQQRAGEQQLHGFAGVNVAKLTGEPVLGISSPGVTTLSGPAGFQMNYRPSNAAMDGMPAGWALNPSGATSRWTTMTLRNRDTVELRQADGFSVTFVRSGSDGAFVAQLGPHHGFPGGGYADLFQNEDGTFTVTDVNQMVTTFPKPAGSAFPKDLHPKKTWAEGSPSLQQSWKNGRLDRLTDSVSGRKITFFYAPSAKCASPAPGFIAAPTGKLCAARDWAGQVTRISYVQTPRGPQIGRIAIQAQAGPGAEVTDIAWDQSARPAGLRQPLASAAVASGVVAGLGEQDARALTQIEYNQLGRVAKITPPAGLVAGSEQTDAQQARPAQGFDYRIDAQGASTLTITQEGTGVPFIERSVANVATMDQSLVTGPDGCRMRTAFNADDNATSTHNECDGTRASTKYDAAGQPTESRGPTRRALADRLAPQMHTAYDTTAQGRSATREGDPLEGLVMMSFDNDRFGGVPSARSVGPEIGGRAVDRMALNFPGNPSGKSGPWSARLTGDYVAQKKGSYRFRAQGAGVRMFVNGKDCAPGECTISLAKGARAHLQASFAATGPAGLSLQAARPGRALQPIPAGDLVPALQQVTEQWTDEELAPGAPAQPLKQQLEYDNQTGGQLVKETSAKGTTVGYRWAPYTGTAGNYGQRTGWTNARGKLIREKYYGATQKATTCDAKSAQGGLLRSSTPPGGSDAEQVYDPAGRVAKATGPETEMCVVRDASGQATSGSVSSPGSSSYSIGANPIAGANPLTSTGTVSAQGQTTTATSEISITGAPHRQTDSYGTVTTYAYDPATGSPTTITERTAAGQQRTRTFQYDALGRMTQMAIDGVVLERISYRQDGFPLSVDFHNGTTATVGLDQNNNLTTRTFSGFAGGVSVGETSTFSRGGSVLRRTLNGPDGSATFSYAYNKDHRLIRSDVSGDMPVSTDSSTVTFTGPSGANGNRQKQTQVAADDTTTTWGFSYDAADRLISSSKPGINPLDYDAQGRATRVGATALEYDAAGNLTAMSSPKGQMAFLGTGDTEYRPAGESPVTLRASGDLLLDQDGMIAGQVIGLSQGVSVGLDESGQPVMWNYSDLQGSTAWRTTAQQAPSATTLYDPWGEQISGAGPKSPATPLELAMSMQGWAGTVRTPIGDDLYVMGAREYSPAAGRFVQPDPVVGGSMNPYEFGNGDPLNNRDSSGQLSAGRGAALGISIFVGLVMTVLTKGGYIAVASVKKGALVGATAGAVSGATSSTVQQGIDNGWDSIDWQESLIQAGIGAAVGAAVGGASAKYAVSKSQAPRAVWKGRLADLKEQRAHFSHLKKHFRTNDPREIIILKQQVGLNKEAITEAKWWIKNIPDAPLPTTLLSAGMFVAGSGTPIISTGLVQNPLAAPAGPPAPDPGAGAPDEGIYQAGSAGGVALRAIVGG